MAGLPKGKAALETLHINEKKWSKEVMDAGWVAFPSILLEKQQAIGLTRIFHKKAQTSCKSLIE